MKKFLLIIVLLVSIIVTGCSNNESITIYSCMEENRNQALKEMLKEEFPNLNINLVYMSTGNTAAKVKTEKEDIEADMIIALETAHMEKLKDNFDELTFFDDKDYVDGINPKHKKYLMHEKASGSVIVDRKYFKEHDLDYPETYEDLLDEDFKGLIAMPDPKTSNTGYMFYLNVINEMGEKEGLKYFDKLSKNILQFTASGSGPMNLLNQGEIAIALGMTYQGVEEINKGADYKIIELDTNTPYNTTSSGIIKGRSEKENVKEVFNFIMTDASLYDKENFVPGKIFKKQDSKIKNYPDLKDANMEGLTDIKLKEDLISKWKY